MSIAQPDAAASPFDKWAPSDLLTMLRDLPLREVDERIGENGILLVRLANGAFALGASLAAATTATSGTDLHAADTLEFRTTFADGDSLPFDGATGRGAVGDREDAALRGLRGAALYVVPLRKRSDGAAFLEKITIGRTRNHDIVLREGSVSKFHAAFLQRDGRLHVKDMDSKNRTRVNGEVISIPTPLVPGDTLAFGSVEAVYCTGQGLWHVLQGR